MGAIAFVTEMAGATVQAAFGDAVRLAQYNHGHGGYSGTIAEKAAFKLFSVPVGAEPEAVRQAARGATRYDLSEIDRGIVSVGASRAEVKTWNEDIRSQHPGFDIISMARGTDDKWGPAGAMEIQEGEWVFFGWASD